MTQSFDYINRTYGLDYGRGTRIEYTGDRATKIVGPFHPTWELRALEDTPNGQ